MQFAIVNPRAASIEPVECKDIQEAYKLAGLHPLGVDHGVVMPGLGIVVYEYSLFVPIEEQAYFALYGNLYAGNAVLYAFGDGGESLDLKILPRVIFMPSAAAVERNIELGQVQRPQMSVNGVVMWRWPEPRQ